MLRFRQGVPRLALAALAAAAVCQAATLVRYPYLQNVAGERATIIWTTLENGAAQVEYSTDRSFSVSVPASTRRFGTTETGLSAAYFHHQAELTGLSPGTQYFYRVAVDGQVLTPGDEFRTAGPGPFSFLVLGDSGLDSPEQRRVAQLMLQERPALVLHTGDIAYEDGTFEQFQRTYFDYYRDLMKRVPFFPTLGNHEYHTNNAAPYLAVHALPASDDVPAADRGRYYSFDWGNAHFVSLDSNTPLFNAVRGNGRMLEWLENDLRRARAFWRFVYFHHPVYPSSRHENDPRSADARAYVAPILDRYDVPLVFNGHEHNYQQSYPLRGGSLVEPGAGTVYVVTGGGGGVIHPVLPRPWVAFARDVHHYLRVDVQGPRLNVRAIAVDGSVIDSFTVSPPPVASANGTVNAASFTTALAPGGLISVFGRHFAAEENQARSLPLPGELSGVTVTLNGRRLPLLYVSGTQINAQLPFDVTGTATLRVATSNGATAETSVTISEAAPAIFASAVVRSDGSFVSAFAPAEPGEFVSVYLTGLGRVDGEIAPGQAAPLSLLFTVRAPVEVQIAGAPVTPLFAGLAPGYVGLYQVNLRVPEWLDTGTHSLRVMARGAASNSVVLAVRALPPPPEP